MRKVEETIQSQEITQSLMFVLDETLKQCEDCEDRGYEAIKIANCVLTKEEYYELLRKYKRFENNFFIFETLYFQITQLESVLQAMSMTAILREVCSSMDELINIMEKINDRIDAKKINVVMAQLIADFEKLIEYDAIDYEALECALEAPYVVLRKLEVFDEEYKLEYSPFTVLKVESFNSKVKAYEYALSQGIRKEYVIEKG